MRNRPARLDDAIVMIDCRFLGTGGAGRVTEMLLRGLSELDPPGRWLLWGPPAAKGLLWGDALWEPTGAEPTERGGQADLFRVPRHDVALYTHQIRPFRPGRSMTLVYDTIPLRYTTRRALRAAKRAYLIAVSRISTRIGTLSRYSQACIERDLRMSPARISVLPYPVDEIMAGRIRALREEVTPEDSILYVGRFGAHKNIPGLIEGFARSAAARDGTTLRLVGGSEDEVEAIRPLAARNDVRVEVRGGCSQAELERLYASTRMVIMASLEEGFGLPAWEAASAGLRACVSDIPVFRELMPALVAFDPLSPQSIASGIDERLSEPPGSLPGTPGPREVAAAFLDPLELTLVP